MSQPLALLRHHQGSACALILQSIESSHQGILRFDDLLPTAKTAAGVPVISGAFTHLPSGREYVIAISAVPQAIGSSS